MKGLFLIFYGVTPDFSLVPVQSSWFSSGHPEWIANPVDGLEGTVRLWPHLLRGEGHFAAVLMRQPTDAASPKQSKEPSISMPKELDEFCKTMGITLPDGDLISFGKSLWMAPKTMPVLKGSEGSTGWSGAWAAFEKPL